MGRRSVEPLRKALGVEGKRYMAPRPCRFSLPERCIDASRARNAAASNLARILLDGSQLWLAQGGEAHDCPSRMG